MLVRRERQSARIFAGEQDALVGASSVDSASTLVYVLGIGLMIYIGLEFVLPALFGATAKTKRAYHGLRTGDAAMRSTVPMAPPAPPSIYHRPPPAWNVG